MRLYKLVFYIGMVFTSFSLQAQKIMGFSDSAAIRQAGWEKDFDTRLNAKDLDTWMQYLTSHPHHVGSPQGKANATYMANLFASWGYQTRIETFTVLFPTPKVRELALLGQHPYKARLEEPGISSDKTSFQKKEQLPTYNAYSADGDVTAPLVFVNRGIPADYEELERMGIDVKGKIVIARYGGSWRGIKPKVAAEHGAAGCLIYSDPADDGYAQGDAYPAGPFRPKEGAQRGSVMDMPVYPGDPLTPGTGATPEAARLDRKDAVTIMKIPVMPISYEDALPLLQSLGGQAVPPSWRGGLPITYHVGPGSDNVHLKLSFNWDMKPIYDVIAVLPGSLFPDEWVLRGNHHDGWVNGAADPVSGLVAELEEAKGIAELVKNGYRLKRTLVYCAWDGEEPALLGSTEWVETHQEELIKKAVVYINSDENGSGFIGGAGSHILEPFFNEVTGDVLDPQTGVTIRERRYAGAMMEADKAGRARLAGNRNVKLAALGAGSDYSPFLQHLGIASMNLGFGGQSPTGVYHSVYDSYSHFTRFIDPGFKYGIALAKTAGRVTMRMANADVLPVNFNAFYRTVADYAAEVKTLLDNQRTETDIDNQMIRDDVYHLGKDPKKTYISPASKTAVPYLDFSTLENEMAGFKGATEDFQKVYGNAVKLPQAALLNLNEILFRSERSLVQGKGLPRRSWYKNQIYAPGFYTGYGVKTLPGIREAIEQRNWKEAQDNISIVAETIHAYTGDILKAIALLNGGQL